MRRAVVYLKEKWGLGPFGLIAVLAAFSLAGSSTLLFRAPIFELFPSQTPGWAKTLLYLVIFLPVYQALLLLYGTLFGQFHFFWQRQKKLLVYCSRLLGGRRKSERRSDGRDLEPPLSVSRPNRPR